MILNHLWGLYAHPREEWHTIDREHEGASYSIMHIMLIALIPSVCSYFSTVYIGWRIGAGDPIYLSPNSALVMGIAMYVAVLCGVGALAYLAKWMAQTFGSNPTYTQCLELASYTATPLLMVGFATLYPVVWFIMLVGLVGLSYSVYLLYSGIPILMHIPEERGFIYASSVVTCGLVLLVSTMVATVILWNLGLGPEFVH
ncbi:Yip1 family protein [Echinimonas agarilytica]|uniref:YIP1 family protein n=1 Tax=Echinimonas agarilytica TaxID=1215918 RepID=A0AA41W5B6_9GAMM|nr:Yip1 family protein [Echinimonas agarilytica]MCM2679249.1 YIP1 family protein [Echinimonas agarilytica]